MYNKFWIFLLLVFPIVVSAQTESLSLEQIWGSGMFRSEYVYGLNSMNDGKHYTTLDQGRGNQQSLNKYAYNTGEKVETIVEATALTNNEIVAGTFRIDGYSFSADESKLLITTKTERIYRHSTRAINYIYDLTSKKLQRLSKGKQRYATFSPDGSKVGFVRDNNLFIVDLATMTETQITEDGQKNEVIYGATDWVYEEEFAFDKAFFWSPSGSKIAFYRFDESQVKEFNMPIYGSLYPQDNFFKYPKAGEMNSKVHIMTYDLNGKNITPFEPNYSYEYIPRVKWSRSDDELIVYSMNRHQSELTLTSFNPTNKTYTSLYKENNQHYIDINDNFYILPDNQGFIYTSEKSGYNHLYYNSWNGKKEYQITKGEWDVSEVYGVDAEMGKIYFQAGKKKPTQREIYEVSIKGNGLKELSTQAGWNDATFSNGFEFFINTYTNASTPAFITLHQKSGEQIRVLKDNSILKKTLSEFKLTQMEFLTLNVGNQNLNASIMKPVDFDPNKKYPVLMYVYGGPGSQTVKDAWGGANYLWYQMMTQKGYIIVSVDNRGTGARGEAFKKVTYKQLGKYETEDQIAAAKWLATQSYVDASRIGIWGWSYGGYMSSLCLFKGNDIFKTAIAVAPVTNWKYYDSIYTERYMQTPQENPGYDENSPITHVDKLTGNYLLIHGTGDDNVHFQNAVEMVSALQKANKQFDLMMYPNKNHGIYGGNTRLHLFQLITDYLEEKL